MRRQDNPFVGIYGNFTIVSKSGRWEYKLDPTLAFTKAWIEDGDISGPEEDSFAATVSSGGLLTSEDALWVSLRWNNGYDAPTIKTAVFESTTTPASELVFTTSGFARTAYGTFSINSTATETTYKYTVDASRLVVQQLSGSTPGQETIEVSSSGGSDSKIVVLVRNQGGVVTAEFLPAFLNGKYGTFISESEAGAWSYEVADGRQAVQGLAPGQSVNDSVTFTSGMSSTTISATITKSPSTSAVSATIDGPPVVVAGALSGEAAFLSQSPIEGTVGTFPINTQGGRWEYAVDSSDDGEGGLLIEEFARVIRTFGSGSDTIARFAVAVSDAQQRKARGGLLLVSGDESGKITFKTDGRLDGKRGAFSIDSTERKWNYDINPNAPASRLVNNDTLTLTISE